MRGDYFGELALLRKVLLFTLGALFPRGGPVQDPVLAPFRRFRAKMEQLEKLGGLLHESQGQHLASTVLYVPSVLHSGKVHPSTHTQTHTHTHSGLRRGFVNDQLVENPRPYRDTSLIRKRPAPRTPLGP